MSVKGKERNDVAGAKVLEATDLLANFDRRLVEMRSKFTGMPGLALIWVGSHKETERFVNIKKRKAAELDCLFELRHFETIGKDHLVSVIETLDQRKDIHGIVLQLPLAGFSAQQTEQMIGLINPAKDVDGLVEGSSFEAPTASGIVDLIDYYHIDPREERTVIVGNGKLVGSPLAEMFRQRHWPFEQILENAESRAETLRKATLVVSCTGVRHLITSNMVTKDTILIDGTTEDVDFPQLKPLVKMITPAKGAIGPLTVNHLFENLLKALENLTPSR